MPSGLAAIMHAPSTGRSSPFEELDQQDQRGAAPQANACHGFPARAKFGWGLAGPIPPPQRIDCSSLDARHLLLIAPNQQGQFDGANRSFVV